MKWTALVLTLFLAAPTYATDLSSEVQQLNEEFGRVMPYPILILDKNLFRSYLASHGMSTLENSRLVAARLIQFANEKYQILFSPSEALELTKYLTTLDNSANSQPFFDRNTRKTTSCVVLQSQPRKGLQEVKRILGADGQEEIFHGLDFEKAEKLLSEEEIQLFSLYHELAHCLDTTYFPQVLQAFEMDPHQMHQAEAFAEVTALILLNKRKGLKLGAPRSVIRTLYSNYYGPYLAQMEKSPFGGNPLNNFGGSIYFLGPVVLKTQSLLEFSELRNPNLTLAETLEAAKNIVQGHSIDQRSLVALHMYFQNPDQTLTHYERLATKSPRNFIKAYQDLLYFKATMEAAARMTALDH